MAFGNIPPSSTLAYIYPEDLRQHAATLMEKFEAVTLAMDKVSEGAAQGAPQTVDYLPGDTTIELEVKRFARNLTQDQSDSLSEVVLVPRQIFDGLYQSCSQLNLKLTARVDINITPKSHDSGHALDYQGTSRPSPPTSAAPHSLGHSNFCEDLPGVLELFEGQIEDMVDRCCVCFTLTREEELMTTPCCLRAVVSICFEEALQETGKCCLCHAHKPKSLVAIAAENAKTEIAKLSMEQFSTLFKLSKVVAGFLVPFLAQYPASQQSREPAENAPCKILGPSTQVSTTISVPPVKLHLSAEIEKGKHQTEAQGNHRVTKNHVLKLFDRDVICHLTGVHKEHLLSLVQSALREHVHHTVCKGFFQRAQVLEERYVSLSIFLDCSPDPDLLIRLRDWPWVYESFVLTTQLQSYKVSMDNIQIGTMSVLQGFEKSKPMQMLLNDNGSVLKSFKRPADVRGINWSRGITDLRHSSTYQLRSDFLLPSKRTKLSKTDLFGITSAVKHMTTSPEIALLRLVAIRALGWISQTLALLIPLSIEKA